MNEITAEIYRAILTALESRLHLIGSVITADARRGTLAYQPYPIYDKGDFYQALGYVLSRRSDGFVLSVGSNVRHEPYVLGGKVPSWTPIAPLKAWVERKNLAWTDKRTGAALSVDQMAHMIQHAIRKRGIPARNVHAEVLAQREQWIFSQLDSIEVNL